MISKLAASAGAAGGFRGDMISRIYISHCEQDLYLAEDISAALSRVGLECLASYYDSAGLLRSERASFGIRNSDCFVPLLTTGGSLSRTVNQEIGFARALDRLIMPVVEEGTEVPFLIEHLSPITFSDGDCSDAIGELIRTIRSLSRLEWLRVRCPGCSEEMTQYLTPQDDVDRAVRNGIFLETVCSYCERAISIDPRTLKPVR